MGAVLGTIGALVEATQFEQRQAVSMGAQPSFFEGLDGARTAFIPPRAGRTLRRWDISMAGARPAMAAEFQSLVIGERGNGPFFFHTPLAQITNMLTPSVSTMTATPVNGTPGAMTLPNIGSVRAAVGSASLTMPIGRGTPVWPGRPISASVWIAASERVRVMLQGRNAAGSWTTRAEVSVQPGEMRNVGLTLHPTAETVSASLELLSTAAFTAARPSITWTETPPAWSPGRGAAQVVIHDYADTEDQASRWSQSTQRMSYSATVTEVGRGA